MNGTETQTHDRSNDQPARASDDRAPVKPRDFARSALGTISALPASLDAQLKGSPYTAVAIALTIGTAAGILLRSRILRAVLASAASYAAVELGRAYIREIWSAARVADKA
jgi:hypothetical protein